MKKALLFLLLTGCVGNLQAQKQPSKTRFLIGLSVPEFAHIGLSTQLTNTNLIGISAGIAPTWGGIWPSLNAEHRLYLGKTNPATQRKQWFFRQSVSYFPSGKDLVFALTVGADLTSKRAGSGWTIDAGVLQLLPDEKGEQARYAPALRFQFYGFLNR